MVNKISLVKALINIIDNHMNPTIDTVSMILASIDCTLMCHFHGHSVLSNSNNSKLSIITSN